MFYHSNHLDLPATIFVNFWESIISNDAFMTSQIIQHQDFLATYLRQRSRHCIDIAMAANKYSSKTNLWSMILMNLARKFSKISLGSQEIVNKMSLWSSLCIKLIWDWWYCELCGKVSGAAPRVSGPAIDRSPATQLLSLSLVW